MFFEVFAFVSIVCLLAVLNKLNILKNLESFLLLPKKVSNP